MYIAMKLFKLPVYCGEAFELLNPNCTGGGGDPPPLPTTNFACAR